MDPAAFAVACHNLGGPPKLHLEAEQALLLLRSSPHAISTALEIIKATSKDLMSSDELVAFHAALLLRDAAVRQYRSTDMGSALGLMQQSLDMALVKPVRGSGDALLQTCAALYKRSFLDMTEEGRVLLIKRVMELMGESRTEWHALKLLLHLIWEFSLTEKSTYLGQTLEFHSKCGRLFTRTYLKDVFMLVATQLPRIQTPGAQICALELLEAILSWPFDRFRSADDITSVSSNAAYSIPVDQRAGTLQLRSASTKVSPGAEWSFLVTSGDFVNSVMGIYKNSCSGFGSIDDDVKSRVHQILVSLSCLSGDVFGGNDAIRNVHAQRMAAIGYSLCQNAFQNREMFVRAIHNDDMDTFLASELMYGCAIVSRALTITPPEIIFVQSATSNGQDLISNVLGLTLAISEACRQLRHRHENHFLGDCLRSCLHVWVVWVSFFVNNTYTGNQALNELVGVCHTHSSRVLESLLETKWITAALVKDSYDDNEGDDDDDETELEELSDLASIARMNPSASLQYLIQALRLIDQAKHDSPETRAERLGFLFRLISDTLADLADGETPIIPKALLEYSTNVGSAREKDLVVQASLCLLEVFQQETLQRLNLISPLLSEYMLASLKRWAASYLFPSPSLYSAKKSTFAGLGGSADNDDGYETAYKSNLGLSEALQANFGDLKKGMEITNFLVKTVCVHLINFGSEPQVSTHAVQLLDQLLTCNKDVVRGSGAWIELCQAHLASLARQDTKWDPLSNIGAVAHGELSGLISSSFEDPNDFDRYCFLPMQQRLRLLVEQSSTSEPVWIDNCVRLCECYKGSAKSSFMGTDLSARIRERIIDSLGDLCMLAELACSVTKLEAGGEAVMIAIIAVFADFCEAQLAFTESKWIPTVFESSKRIIDLFARITAPKVALQRQKETVEELEFRAGNLNKILKLLIGLSERNSLDFSSSPDENAEVVKSDQEQDVSGVILAGIDAVLPLFDRELFQIPEVVESYFDLVSGVCRTRPEHVCQLPPSLFQQVATSLTHGCEHHDSKVQRWCFESIASLVKTHVDSRARSGTVGLLEVQIQNKPTIIFDFVNKTLELVVVSTDLLALDAAATALLTLAQCDMQTFSQAADVTVQKLMTHRRDGQLIDASAEHSRIQTLYQVLRTQFDKLFEGVRVHVNDRTDRKKMATNVTSFVREVRPYVLMK